jgi:YD repeat-containing protein
VTANQRFPIFFEEKRPFFLEGIDIFQTQLTAVHTRAIVDPDYAVKLSGKVDRNTFGVILASDNAPGNFTEDDRTNPDVFPGIQRFVDKNAAVGILRLKRDVGKSDSFIGFLTTYRRFVDSYNELGGFDGRFRFDKQTTFSWQVLGTHSRHLFFFPEEGELRDSKQNGFSYALDYNQSGRHFGHEFTMVGRTRYYVADVGFNRRPNTNNPNWFLRYNSEPKPKAKLISWRVYTDFNANFDWQGRSQNFNNETQIQFQLPAQTYFGTGVDKGYDRVFESEFGPKRQPGSNCVVENTCTFAGNDNERSSPTTGLYVFGGSTPSKKYNFNFFLFRGWGSMDFDFGAGPKYPRVSPPALAAREAFAAGLCDSDPLPSACRAPQDPGPGDSWRFDGGVTYQPTSALNARLSYTKERLTRYDTGRIAFDENIISLRTTYQFTRFLFARGRIDYDSLASNVKGQFLLGWTPNPGTAFYAGYNDDLNRNGFSPFTGQLEPGFRRNGRTFFIKMSYLFRRSF